MIVEGGIRRRDNRIWYLILGVFAATFLFTFLNKQFTRESEAEAASLANFDPGYIISDWQMGNYTSMTEAEIQAFLNSKGNCRDTNIGKASNYPSLSYHIKDGHFVCLAEETFGDGINYGEAAPAGDSAAHIIWQAAQDYKINPQVLIVLLQKEQGLITDSWPNNVQYRSATGYGCPDTAACSTKYYGFKNQVRNAASMFRTVLDDGWTNYPLGENYVQYNPNAACGGSVVNIRSLATSALYRYTPYQPNAGALAAGYGTASCGAYGNRNFYLYFQDWFGGITSEHRVATPATPGEKIESILDGVEYTIVSALDQNFALDIHGGVSSLNDGANIQLYGRHDGKNQKFVFSYNENGFYGIINSASGKALNAYSGLADEETNIQLWERDGSCASYWRVDKEDDGSFRLQSSCSDLVMDIYGGKALNEKNIQLYSDHEGKNQRWVFIRPEDDQQDIVKDALYVITSANDDEYAIDIYGGVTRANNGSNIQLYKKHNGENQQFKFVYNESKGLYEIVNPSTNKSLNVYGGWTSAETNIQLWERDGSCASYWGLNKDEDGKYTFKSACSDLVMDIYGGKALNEKNIQLYLSHGRDNQKWVLEKQ